MKKILTLLSGIVFLITVLVAGGCSSETTEDDPQEDLKKVTIYVKLIIGEDGKKHLQLSESDIPESMVIDSLHVADVDPGTKVVWRRAEDSGIKKFKRVAPVKPGEIFPEDASTILLHKRYRARVPDKEIEPDTKEKYDIVFVDKDDNEEVTIDPYLRIRVR